MTVCLALAWLFANPQVRLVSQTDGWIETGAAQAIAKTQTVTKVKKKHVRRTVPRAPHGFGVRAPQRGSAGLVLPTPLPAPTRFPRATVTPPALNSALTPARPVPRYESVPTVAPLPQIGGESFGDRVTRCVHQGGLGGLNAGQLGAYVPSCAQ